MRAAAIYARFSTELQNDKSVEDQIDLCVDFARTQGFAIVGKYSDKARTGTTMHGRDGLQRLLSDARAGGFKTVIVEALDRLSRDTEDLAGIHKRLTYAGIEIISVHDGRADAMQIGIRSLVSTLFIADLKHKTRRGLAAVVKAGRHAGGLAYGYRPVLGQPGILEIYEPEAEIVRRIFDEYIGGAVPRAIAAGLNEDGIPSPRGGSWNASTINGNAKRGHGILLNQLYAGKIIWNKTHMLRNPDTGRRLPRMNPEDEWKYGEAPHLAIVSEETLRAAKATKEKRAHIPSGRSDKRHTRLLSGFIRCPKCGGTMTVHDNREAAVRIKCSKHRESGACGNNRTYRLDRIERAVIDGLLDRLRNPDLISSFIASQQEERRTAAKIRASAERTVARIEGEIDRLSKALISGRVDDDFFDRQIGPLRRELQAARESLLTAPGAKIITLHPTALAMMEQTLILLSKHLPNIDPEEDRDMFEAFRSLIDRVDIIERKDGGIDCEVIGRLSSLIDGDAGDNWGGIIGGEGARTKFPPIFFGRFAA